MCCFRPSSLLKDICNRVDFHQSQNVCAVGRNQVAETKEKGLKGPLFHQSTSKLVCSRRADECEEKPKILKSSNAGRYTRRTLRRGKTMGIRRLFHDHQFPSADISKNNYNKIVVEKRQFYVAVCRMYLFLFMCNKRNWVKSKFSIKKRTHPMRPQDGEINSSVVIESAPMWAMKDNMCGTCPATKFNASVDPMWEDVKRWKT